MGLCDLGEDGRLEPVSAIKLSDTSKVNLHLGYLEFSYFVNIDGKTPLENLAPQFVSSRLTSIKYHAVVLISDHCNAHVHQAGGNTF